MNGKRLSLITFAIVCTAAPCHAAVLAHWDFNSRPADSLSTTGTLMPAQGVGVAWPVGNVNSGFAAGSPNDLRSDDTAWNTSGYPPQGTGNKTAGIQLGVPTLGHTNITVRFEQRATGTASRFARLQYSTNGLDFGDLTVLELTEATVFLEHEISLAAVAGVNDNPNLIFRVVTEFQSTATGSGPDSYATPGGGNYSSAGTLRFDLVSVLGDPIRPDNTIPVIEPITDQTTVEATSTGPIEILCHDLETATEDLIVVVSSFNVDLIPLENITLGVTPTGRTLELEPAPGHLGTGIVVVTVLDDDGASASREFMVTVTPANAAPTVSVIPHQTSLLNETIAQLEFTIDDLETPADLLDVAVSTPNPELAGSLLLGGGGSQRSLTLTPVAGQAGTAAVTVRVSDGFRATEQTFVWMVLGHPDLLVHETFGYGNGSIVSNAPGRWIGHAGTAGQLQIQDRQAILSTSQSEDVHIRLPGGPYTPESATVLYLSFKIRCTQVPASGGQYFLHFNTTAFRGRVFASGESGEFYRLGVSNGGTAPNLAPDVLELEQDYAVVVSYDTATGITTLWIDPVSAIDTSTQAEDSASPTTISSLAFRQQTGIGRLAIRELKVGTSFEQVVAPEMFTLRIKQLSDAIELSWDAAASDWQLQTNLSLEAESWSDLTDAAELHGDRLVVRLSEPSDTQFFRLRRP